MSNQNILDKGWCWLLAACVLMLGIDYVLTQAEHQNKYKLYYGKQCESVGTAHISDGAGKVNFRAPPRAQPQSVDPASKALRSGSNLLTAGADAKAIGEGDEIFYDLPITYTLGTINNPATGKDDQVCLRSYENQFLAPTIEMKPGQTVRLGLRNQLPLQPDCDEGKGTNQPHCFNTTNLHSHGLWISPAGNSDNVLTSGGFRLRIRCARRPSCRYLLVSPAQARFQRNTGRQRHGGCSEGDRPPTPQSNGDLDLLLRPFEPKEVERKGDLEPKYDYKEVMLLQQIPYACFDKQDPPKIQTEELAGKGRWSCKDDQVGVVEDFDAQVDGRETWRQSGRYTLINGVPRPPLELEAGRIYRWRLVDSGVFNTIALRISKIKDLGQLRPQAASSEDRADEVKRLCTGTDVTQFEVAADGLTRGHVFGKTTNYLQPGYRSDVLFVLPETGEYCVYDAPVPAEGAVTLPAKGAVSAEAENANVLAIITATGGEPVKDQKAFLTEQLLAAADKLPADATVKAQVKVDLEKGLRLSKFVPHSPVTDEEVATTLPVPIKFDFERGTGFGLVNGKPYELGRMDQTLILGGAQSWRLSSSALSHPFHIHVNPFEIVSVIDKENKEDKTLDKNSEYWGMKGLWKDTLFVEGDPKKGVVIEVRTRYERYIGPFVMHCHILPHEDTGMMQNVQIVSRGQADMPTLGGH
jgi:L-ascorbate oxidase